MKSLPNRDPGRGDKTPVKYELGGHWHFSSLGRWALLAILAGGMVVMVLAFFLGSVAREMLRGPGEFNFSIGLTALPIFLGIIAITIILHEAVHALAFLFAGGKPHFGFKLIGRFFPVVYASAPGLIFPRNRYLLVGLAPFVTLTLLFLVTGMVVSSDGIALMALMVMAMNVAGSIGDMMMIGKVRQHRRETLFEDTADGFNWYYPPTPNL